MILCVTPNPALDRTMTVPGLHLGEAMRASYSFVTAGGKGLNVARVVRVLGGPVLCAGFLGGHSGHLLADLAEREGLPAAWTWFAGETRTSVILFDPQGGDATVVNEPGQEVTQEEWARLTADMVAKELGQLPDVHVGPFRCAQYRPGRRSLISCSSQPLPSGSPNVANER